VIVVVNSFKNQYSSLIFVSKVGPWAIEHNEPFKIRRGKIIEFIFYKRPVYQTSVKFIFNMRNIAEVLLRVTTRTYIEQLTALHDALRLNLNAQSPKIETYMHGLVLVVSR